MFIVWTLATRKIDTRGSVIITVLPALHLDHGYQQVFTKVFAWIPFPEHAIAI